MKAKDRHKKKMLEYWGDPENDFVNRGTMHKEVLKISGKTFYGHFTPAELLEIESEASKLRRERSGKQRANVLGALYKRAVGYSHPDVHISVYQGDVIITDITKHYPPDPVSAREFLDRTEGKVAEKVDHTIDSKSGVLVIPGQISDEDWLKLAQENDKQLNG
ncbi:MAG: hypothetical protein MI862_27100 [Desulfobacterales bacterium]|nr:hypothetical protein [Desulfobacterales bacterium]